MHVFIQLMNHYGYFYLMLSIYLEMLAFPFPNELLMSYVGYMVYQDKMILWLAALAGIVSCMLGASTTYWIGRWLGTPFFYKYGHYVHLYPERLDKLSDGFNAYGKRLLLFTNFVPGVRHFSGYAAGISRVNYRAYFIYTTVGSVLWVSTFLLLGTFLGPKYKLVADAAKEYFSVIMLSVLGGLLLYALIKSRANDIRHWALIVYRSLFVSIQSRIRLKVLIVGAALVLSVLLSLLFGMLDHILEATTLTFNRRGLLLLHIFLSLQTRHALAQLSVMARPSILICLFLLVGLWILIQGTERKIEFQMFLFLVIGGLLYSTYLPRWIAHFVGDAGQFAPDGGLIIAFVLIAYFVYLIARHTLHYLLSVLAVCGGAAAVLETALAAICRSVQLPSDIVIDLMLAGIWFSFVVLCLEFLRLIYFTDRQFHQDMAIYAQRRKSLKKIN